MKRTDGYADVIAKTTAMVQDEAVQHLADKHGLQVLDITWEDTARFDFSAVGPNISDMTIQVQHKMPDSDQYLWRRALAVSVQHQHCECNAVV